MRDMDFVIKSMLDEFLEIDDSVHRNTDGSQIVQFFNGKSVLITGATGFIGKLLLEKLLRACKDIKKVYLVMRPKKNKDVHERLDELLEDVVFSQLRKMHPEFPSKIKAIPGDISLPNLNIDQRDAEILKDEVNVVFHMGALVGMAEKLSASALSNVRGTRELLEMSRNFKDLVSFVYVSTAYSFCPKEFLDEKFYDPPYEADVFLRMVQSFPEDLDNKQKKMIGNWPNTYVFTKAIAEHLVKNYSQDMPACIIRPSVVCSTFKEPLRSWVGNHYGMMGCIANHMLGIQRTFNSDVKIVLDMVPADYFVNALIAVAYNNIHKRDDTKIYNYVSSPENPIEIGYFFETANNYGETIPTIKSLLYPSTIVTKNFHIHLVLTFLLGYLPAILFDIFLTIIGKKRRIVFFTKLVHKFNRAISYFALREWKYSNNNVQELWKNLSETDKQIFNFNLSRSSFNWHDYMRTLSVGIRVYLLKDDITSIPAALKKHKKLYFWDKCSKVSAMVIFLWILWYVSLQHWF